MRPPVKALYVYNSNPASICPNQELVLRGLAREDLFTVVHEQHLTDTTDYADVVLPATTSMEHVDLYKSFGHLYVQLAEPVVAPAGESRSNWQVVRTLAQALTSGPALRQGRGRADPRGAGLRRPVDRWYHLRAAPRRALGAPAVRCSSPSPTRLMPSGRRFTETPPRRAGRRATTWRCAGAGGGAGAALSAPVHRANRSS
jgi:anaerobic selenocysteine-containing dehydrogenase